MKLVLETTQQAKRKSNTWLIPVFEGQLAKASKAYGFDLREARAWGFAGETGQSLNLALGRNNQHALLIGAGKTKDFTTEQARKIVSRSIRCDILQQSSPSTVMFAGASLSGAKVATEALVEALAEGAVLGGYAFTQLRGKGTEASALPQFPKRLIIAVERLRPVDRRRFKDGLTMAKWTNWGRELLNQSQSHVTATKLANTARAAAKGNRKIRCTIWGKKEIAAAKMGLLLAVNQGSTEPPRFIVLQYSGGRKADKPVCLIGKGITYDTGGYNLKMGEGMRGMHMDKGGAIGTLASFFAVAEMGISRNLVCLVPSTDNRISGSAMVCGDVFVAANGISVEVDNTDAEGRLVLADALAYAKKFSPSHIVDMATLTGAAVIALGDQASAMFCTDDAMAGQLSKHAEEAGELLWRLPLWSEYNAKLKSKTADIKNTGGRWGGAITAALFLQRFVPPKVKWCHLDIAGKMSAEDDHAYTPTGSGHGFGPRLIARWLRAGK